MLYSTDLDTAIAAQCEILAETSSDMWEKKNKAITDLIHIFIYSGSTFALQSAFLKNPNLYRSLKEPLKKLLGDLRSQQVRDTCTLLNIMSIMLGDQMRVLLRDICETMLDSVKVANKVISGYIDDCILCLLKHVTNKSCIGIIWSNFVQNKSKSFRERCLLYLNEIVTTWDLVDKDMDVIIRAIQMGLEDASEKCRKIARMSYFNFFLLFPLKVVQIKASKYFSANYFK